MEPLSGKVAVVTGASSGIGEAIARALVILGVHVIGVARRKGLLDEISESLRGANGSFYALHCDVRKEEDILNVFKLADEKFGGIDILVNNAGVTWSEYILNGTTDHYREIMEVNALAPAIVIREGVQSILKRRKEGRIVVIVSNSVIYPLLTPLAVSLYEASKSALHTLILKVRQEIKNNKQPIKITAIYPGLTKTDLIANAGADPDKIFSSPHLQPADIAATALFALQIPGNVEIQQIEPVPLHGV